MPAFAVISLMDSTATPFDFVPSSIDQQGVAKLFSVNDAFDGRYAVSASVRLPKAGGPVARVTMKVVIPLMDDSATPPKKVGETIANIEFVIPKGASALDRANILAFAASLLATTEADAAVNSLESIY